MGKTFKDGFNKEKYNHPSKSKKKSDPETKLRKFKFKEDESLYNDRTSMLGEDDSSEGDDEV